jgi:catalase
VLVTGIPTLQVPSWGTGMASSKMLDVACPPVTSEHDPAVSIRSTASTWVSWRSGPGHVLDDGGTAIGPGEAHLPAPGTHLRGRGGRVTARLDARRTTARRDDPAGTLPVMTTDLDSTAARIHEVLRSVPTTSPTHRALHAKGTVAAGRFIASDVLAGATTAPHLTGGSTPATVRFSHPGGDPDVSDAIPSGRGMAVKLRTPAGAHDLVAVSLPAFLVRSGSSFLELLAARAPDPATGAPDPARILAFVEAHPESLPAIEATLGARVPASYASLAYNGLHTFFLVDAGGTRHPFRYTWSPVGGERFLDTAPDVGFDLAGELGDRLADPTGDTAFDLVVHLGEPGDPTGDPTTIWPERPTVIAGRLRIDRLVDDAEPIIFDPTNVVPGIELPVDDEILLLRRATYGLSFAARTSPPA